MSPHWFHFLPIEHLMAAANLFGDFQIRLQKRFQKQHISFSNLYIFVLSVRERERERERERDRERQTLRDVL
jgi:hypothetical protein